MYLRASPARASPFILQRCTVAMSDRASPRTASMAQDLSRTRRCKNPREPACYVSGSCVPCIFGVPRCCNLGQEPGTRNQGTKSSDAACLPYWNSMREKGHADRTKVHMHKRTGQKRRGKKELLETKRDGARLVGSFSGRLFSEADSRFYGGTHVYVRPLFFLRF